MRIIDELKTKPILLFIHGALALFVILFFALETRRKNECNAVGSIALDSLILPSGSHNDILGGSASISAPHVLCSIHP